jgi:co-chaperonin GroES (HSP10)
MSISIQPVGFRLIVRPLESDEFQTEGGITVMDLEVDRGEVVEVPKELSEEFKKGDLILYSKGSGISLPHYKKSPHLWLNANPLNTEVWGIVTEEKE